MATASNTDTTTTTESNDPPERNVERKGETAKIGNLTRDPELRFSKDDTAYCRFGLAVERPKEPGNWAGERITDFYEITCFKSLAENAARSLTKGSHGVMIGMAEVEHWKDDEGKERTTKRILADACGPDLRWASATVSKATAAKSGGKGCGYDEEPF